MTDTSSQAWPAVRTERLVWEPQETTLHVAMRDRVRIFEAADVPPIGELPAPALAASTWTACHAASTALGNQPAPAVAEGLLRSESIASSRIEQIGAGHRQLARAQANAPAKRNAREVARVLDAALHVRTRLRQGGALDLDLLLDAHARIHRPDEGRHGDVAGALREVQNWIGGSEVAPVRADYVPPPPERVVGLLADLFRWIERPDVHPVVGAAVAHAQFETIHPFVDGNGRTGRILTAAVLAVRGLPNALSLPLSLGIAVDRDCYVDALTAYREGAPDAIVRLVADSIRAAGETGQLADELSDDLLARWRSLPAIRSSRSDSAVHLLLEHLLAHPVVSAAGAAQHTGRSTRSTRDALDRLAEAGIVRKLPARRGRTRFWEAGEVIDLRDRLEDEATGLFCLLHANVD